MLHLIREKRLSSNQYVITILYLSLIIFGYAFPSRVEHMLYLSFVLVASLAAEPKYKVTKHIFIISTVISFILTIIFATDIYYKILLVSLSILVLIHSAFCIVGFLAKSEKITYNEILGLVNCYVIIGFIWAFVYVLLEGVRPGTFAYEQSRESLLDVFISYSFGTLTTFGIGDVTPKSELARRLSITEAMAGQFYFAVIVAYLLNRFVQNRPEA